MPPFMQSQVPLKDRTTLGAGGAAEYYAEVHGIEELREAVAWAKQKELPVTVLGSGTNVLVSDDGVRGLVVHLAWGVVTYNVHGDEVHVHADAGVVLDELIRELTEKGLWSMENLSGIPGTVGAVPIQNVGAYGVEAKDVIRSVTVYDLGTEAVRELENTECQFAYRDSIFKKPEGKKYIILSVTFAAGNIPAPKLSYRDLESIFQSKDNPTLEEIREAVIAIRSRKFPDWNVVGTAGSFFKNPIVPFAEFDRLRAQYPELPGFPLGEERFKIPLGWILDKVCGLRGHTEGSVGLFKEQALVLVCKKGTPAREIDAFAQRVIDLVFEKTNIHVEREVTSLS